MNNKYILKKSVNIPAEFNLSKRMKRTFLICLFQHIFDSFHHYTPQDLQKQTHNSRRTLTMASEEGIGCFCRLAVFDPRSVNRRRLRASHCQ